MSEFTWLYDLSNLQLVGLIVSFFLFIGIAGLIPLRHFIAERFDLNDSTNEAVNGFFSGVVVVYGLLLGLVAVAAWQNYDDVSKVVSQEAAATAALYRDVSTLEDPTRTQLQSNLKTYLSYVIDVAWPGHKVGKLPRGGTIILTDFLGTLSKYKTKSEEQKVFLAEVFRAYNKLIEVRRMRLDCVSAGGFPLEFWIVIISGGVITLFMTYFFYFSSVKTHLLMTSTYAITLGLMIYLLIAVDDPFRGKIGIEPTPYIYVLDTLDTLDPNKLKDND